MIGHESDIERWRIAYRSITQPCVNVVRQINFNFVTPVNLAAEVRADLVIPLIARGTGLAEIIINNLDPLSRPSELDDPFDKAIL
jgi:hypothetical protein